MRRLQFPFWIIEHRNRQDVYLVSFSSHAKAVAYLDAHQQADWEVKIVNRATLPGLLRHLRSHGVKVLYHDRYPDGTGGREIPLADLSLAAP
jgi:hypothetical protein